MVQHQRQRERHDHHHRWWRPPCVFTTAGNAVQPCRAGV